MVAGIFDQLTYNLGPDLSAKKITPLPSQPLVESSNAENNSYFGKINKSLNDYISYAKGLATEKISTVSVEAVKRYSNLFSAGEASSSIESNIDMMLPSSTSTDTKNSSRRFFMVDPYKRVSGQDTFLLNRHQNSVKAVRNLLELVDVQKEEEYKPILHNVKTSNLVIYESLTSGDLSMNSFDEESDQANKNILSSMNSVSSHTSDPDRNIGKRMNRNVSKAETASRLGEGTLRAMRDMVLNEAVELNHCLKFWTERLERPLLYYLEFAPQLVAMRSKEDHYIAVGKKISQLQAVLARRCSSIGHLQQQLWRAGWQSGVEQWGILGQGEWAAVVGAHGEIEDKQMSRSKIDDWITPVRLVKPKKRRYKRNSRSSYLNYYEESHLFVRNVRGGAIQSNDDALAAWTIDALRVVRDQLYGAGNSSLEPLPYYENWPLEFQHFQKRHDSNSNFDLSRLGDSIVMEDVQQAFKDSSNHKGSADLPLWATYGVSEENILIDDLYSPSIDGNLGKIEITDLNLMASEVGELLNSMETNMSLQKRRRLDKLRPPSLLLRSWYILVFAMPIIGYSTYLMIQAEDNMFMSFTQDVYQKVCSFCAEHVYDPLRSIYRELFTKRGREDATDRKARENVVVVLRKMIKAWLDDTYPDMAESERIERAARMDMSLIESTKEYSVKNILDFNKIYRLSLIEMQFIKKELLNSLVQMDELMGANRINMNLAAITPAFLALSSIRFIFRKIFYALLKVGKSREETYSNFRHILLDIERLLVMRDNPPSSLFSLSGNSSRLEEDTISELKSPRNVLTSDDLGMLMLLVHECRIILFQDRNRFSRVELRNVSEDLAELAGERGAVSIQQQLRIIARMCRTYSFLKVVSSGIPFSISG